MVRERTTEERIAELEADREQARADLEASRGEVAVLKAELQLVLGAAAALEVDHERVARALRRGRMPAARPGGREIEVEPKRPPAQDQAIAWLAGERARSARRD